MNLPLYQLFRDCEEALDTVERNVLWPVLYGYETPRNLGNAIKYLCVRTRNIYLITNQNKSTHKLRPQTGLWADLSLVLSIGCVNKLLRAWKLGDRR